MEISADTQEKIDKVLKLPKAVRLSGFIPGTRSASGRRSEFATEAQ